MYLMHAHADQLVEDVISVMKKDWRLRYDGSYQGKVIICMHCSSVCVSVCMLLSPYICLFACWFHS